MRTTDVAPFLMAPPGSVRTKEWARVVAQTEQVLPEYLPEWDQNTTLDLVCRVSLDDDAILQETGVPASDLMWSFNWQVAETSLSGEPVLIPANRTGETECELVIGPERTGPTLILLRRLILRRARVDAPPLQARLPGSVIWSDEQRLRLGGTGADFPVEIIDFSSCHLRKFGRTSWYLDLPNLSDRPALGGLLLMINSSDDALSAAVSAERPNRQQLLALDVLQEQLFEQIVRWALGRWEEVLDASAGSVGEAARSVTFAVLGSDVDSWLDPERSEMDLRAKIIEGYRRLDEARPR